MAGSERERRPGETEVSDGDRRCQSRADRYRGATDRNRVTDPERALQSSTRRRAMVARLVETDDEPSLVTLAADLTSDSHRSTCHDVYLELYHTHLPVLESAGLVDYDEGEGVVALATSGERVSRLLERAVQNATA